MERGKTKLLAAATGAVVGAGAVIASVIALRDHRNKQKVRKIITSAKTLLQSYAQDTADQAINKAEKVTKSVKKEMRKI